MKKDTNELRNKKSNFLNPLIDASYFLNVFFRTAFSLNWKFQMIKRGLRLMFHLYLCEYLFVKMIIQLHQIRENPDRGTDTWKNDNFAILY